MQPVGDDECAGVDERVARTPRLLVELEQRVERVARRFARHSFPDALSLGGDDQREREDLADALHREAHVGVADDMHLAVAGGDRHPELARIHRRQAGDVLGEPAPAHLGSGGLLGA